MSPFSSENSPSKLQVQNAQSRSVGLSKIVRKTLYYAGMAAAPEGLVKSYAAHDEDARFIFRRYASKGLRTMSFVAPLTHVGHSIATRKPLTLQNTLQATVKGGVMVGFGVGVVAGAWAWVVDAERAHEVRTELQDNKHLTRLDKYTFFGSILGGMIAPAILFKRAPVKTLLFAGFGLGSSVGGGVHFLKLLTEPEVSVAPGPAVSALW
ncbi:hypothetical protein FRC09_007849 [Ceratobasidium sp. 395]|nr:hypothetical protein FRC09_007849 [Ceratobasidium sp. 395]